MHVCYRQKWEEIKSICAAGGVRRAAGCPLSATVRMKTNGAVRLSSQAVKHHVYVALSLLFHSPTRHNQLESVQEPHRRLSCQSVLPSPVGRSKRTTVKRTGTNSQATAKAAPVWLKEGQICVSQCCSSFCLSAVTSCSSVKSFASPPDLLTLSLTNCFYFPHILKLMPMRIYV